MLIAWLGAEPVHIKEMQDNEFKEQGKKGIGIKCRSRQSTRWR